MWGEVTFSVGEGWEGRYPSCWLGICQSLKTPLQWNMELCWCSKRKQWKGILGARRENIGSIRNWTLLQNYFHAFWLLSTLHPNCCFHPSNIRILNFQNISSLNYILVLKMERKNHFLYIGAAATKGILFLGSASYSDQA